MKVFFTHKRGDTLSLSGQVEIKQDGATLADITGWTGRSQIRTLAGTLVADLQFTLLDGAQRLVRIFSPAEDTAGWPVGFANIDVEFTSPDGVVVSTETKTINIVEDITYA